MADKTNETMEQSESAETATVEDVMPPISESVTEENDASDDALLDKIFGNDEDEDSAETEPQETPAEVVDETTSDEDDTTEVEPNILDGYDKAGAALQRDGVPRSVIDQMAEGNPQELVDWGLKRSKNQSDVDSYGARLKELEDGKSDDGEPVSEDGESGEQIQSSDQPLNQKEITRYENEIAEIFGEDAAKAVMTPMRAYLKETSDIIQQQQTVINRMVQSHEERELEASRGRLGERFPKLNNEKDFGQVVEQMTKLVQVGEYSNMDDLMTDAYRMKYAEDIAATATSKQRNKIRDAGQPTTTFESSTPSASKSVEEREDAALDALLGGGGFDDAVSAYNG